MSSDPHSDLVRAYFNAPQHSGILKDAAAGYFEDQGIRIRLTASVAKQTILAMRFQAWACPHVIAAAEFVCREFEGGDVRKLEDFSSDHIMQNLGIPIEKTGRILVLEDTVRSLRQAIQDAV